MSLTKSVENLKERVEILTKENTRLQRQLDRQAGQIETPAMFVSLSVNKRIGERAAETPEQPMQATESPAQQTPARPRGTRAKKAKPQE